MKRDRCYHVETPIGPLRVRAGKKPNKRTVKALGELFKAVRDHIESKELRPEQEGKDAT